MKVVSKKHIVGEKEGKEGTEDIDEWVTTLVGEGMIISIRSDNEPDFGVGDEADLKIKSKQAKLSGKD